MAFHGIDTEPSHGHGHDTRAEYWLYFSLIFLIALPFEFIPWTRALLGSRPGRNPGVIARARSRAMIITPTIFSA